MNIDLSEYGINVDGDEALREAVSVAIALEAWGERFRAKSSHGAKRWSSGAMGRRSWKAPRATSARSRKVGH